MLYLIAEVEQLEREPVARRPQHISPEIGHIRFVVIVNVRIGHFVIAAYLFITRDQTYTQLILDNGNADRAVDVMARVATISR